MRESYHYSFIALGISFAFKLQAIFILPFYVFYYVYKKKFSLVYFGYIPICMVMSSIVGLVQGRSFLDIFKIYFRQTHAYKRMFLNSLKVKAGMKPDYFSKTFEAYRFETSYIKSAK